jgi:tetratricopeptide (TPR) repeat protein
LFQIPQYNSQYNSPYIERESNIIQKIKSKLNDTEFSACAIIGSGGVGKTRIMSEYAHEVKKTGAEVFWFSAISADYIKEEIRQFSLEKGLIIEANKDGNYILQVFKNWMVENEDWLFLLDNVEHYQDIKIFLDIDNTLIGKRHILLTSRNEESEIYNIQTVELEVFNKNESLKFLKLHTNQTHNEYTEKIAEYLDGLPLALEQAAAYIREDKTSYKGYYELLEKDTISSLEKKRLSHTESVGATWNISMQRITEAAQQMLYLCSYMAPENIDEILFSENSELLPLPLIEKFSEHLERNNIWSQLTRYSLLKKQDDGEGYSIHRLLQGVVRHKINSEPQWAQCCLSLFYKSYDFKYGDIESQNYFSKLTLHMEHFLNVAKKILTTDEEQKMIVHLYHEGGFGSHHLGNYSSALEYYGCALSICEKILGKEHLNTATTYNNMAEVFRAQGNYVEALKYFNYALAIREREKHPDTASTYNNIAEVFRTLGEYDKALKYYDDALIIYEKNLHPDTAIVYNNMALVFESQGDYDKALKYYSDALIIYEKNLGKEHPNIANTYNNMALVFYTQSNYVKALEYYGYALDIFEKILGKKHPNISSTYNNIAVVFKKQGDYDKALEYYGYALEIREKVFGKEHPNTATTYNNMAGVFYAQGDYDKALEYYGYDLKTCKKILGEEHPDTATAYNNMAMVFKDKGDYNKALEYCSCALTIREKILGKHPSTATTYNNMALIFRAQGDYSKALEYYSYDLEICEEVLGKEHPNTATTYNNMAGVFKDQGNYDKALEWYIKAYRICLNKFGLEHPNTNIALENMVHAYSLSSKTMNFEKWLKEQMK